MYSDLHDSTLLTEKDMGYDVTAAAELRDNL